VLSDSLLEVAVLLLVMAAAVGAVLAVLFVLVRAAVEQGVRRALPDSALRPHVRDVLRASQGDPYEARTRPPAG
jgi:hypothetical protein